jgi:hypothetical protein
MFSQFGLVPMLKASHLAALVQTCWTRIINSGPLLEQMDDGTPKRMNRSLVQRDWHSVIRAKNGVIHASAIDWLWSRTP